MAEPTPALTPCEVDAPATLMAVQTPRMRGAIAVVSIAGPQAVNAVDTYFLPANGKHLAEQSIDRIRFGQWAREGGEELVVCRRQSLAEQGYPHVEVHCHGGEAAVRAILADLAEQGCQTVSCTAWEQLTAGHSIATEAAAALPLATTSKTAAILLDQQQGALEEHINQVVAHVSAENGATARSLLNPLIERIPLGEHLTKPWQVVLAGPPNVGKSSLINAILGYQRAIVFDRPGTTRDVVTATTAINGWPVELSDTAGLRTGGDAIETAGMELALQAVRSADLILYVESAGGSSEELPAALAEKLNNELVHTVPRLKITNKIDLAPDAPHAGIAVSATQNTGLDHLIGAIGEALIQTTLQPGMAVPFTPRQFTLLRQASDGLKDGQHTAACSKLLALTAPTQPAWPVRQKSNGKA